VGTIALSMTIRYTFIVGSATINYHNLYTKLFYYCMWEQSHSLTSAFISGDQLRKKYLQLGLVLQLLLSKMSSRVQLHGASNRQEKILFTNKATSQFSSSSQGVITCRAASASLISALCCQSSATHSSYAVPSACRLPFTKFSRSY